MRGGMMTFKIQLTIGFFLLFTVGLGSVVFITLFFKDYFDKRKLRKLAKKWHDEPQLMTALPEKKEIETDLDLPPIKRTYGNTWKAKYFEACKELGNANRGVRRLKKKLERCTGKK